MAYTVHIREFGKTIPVEHGQTILEAALAAGHNYPCGCRSGNCGTCKSMLVAGTVDLKPYAAFILPEEERASGKILACRALPRSDCEVAYEKPDEAVVHPQRRLACRVAMVEDMARDVRRVGLEVTGGGPFEFSAGQYASATFADLPARDFSMANRADEPLIEFHIRRIAGGEVSGYVFDRLQPGETVTLEGPFGVSYLRENHGGPIIAIAGSTGLAPLKAIAETALGLGMSQGIHLYFGVRDEQDLYMVEPLESLAAAHDNFTFIPVLSEPAGPTERRTGLVTDAVAQDFGDLEGCKAYIAGPPVMIEAAIEMLEGLDMSRDDCHADAFYTEAEKAALDAAS
ncbi:MAG: 2Fe-2S iron-sulfur cluster-binding protein [Alphaproteobacteria bacterium]|nr:2Fe-2S iron-sulfur cluster-binding protein [Alphaproteobacteria bacterium]MDP6517650.1 2Fe-2S iron-sulfur cluster-binding protein [Alphaproteobacteria bacterium]